MTPKNKSYYIYCSLRFKISTIPPLQPKLSVLEFFSRLWREAALGAMIMKLRSGRVLQKAHPKPKGFVLNSLSKKKSDSLEKNLSEDSEISKYHLIPLAFKLSKILKKSL